MNSFVSKGLVSLDMQATNKEGIISEMAEMLVASGRLQQLFSEASLLKRNENRGASTIS